MSEFEFYKDLQEESSEQVQQQEVKSRLKKPVRNPKKIALAVLIVLVLAVVGLASYRGGTGFDVLRRYMTLAGFPENANGTRGSYSFESDKLNRFAPLGEGHLMVVGSKSVQILDGRGSTVYADEIYLDNPVVAYGGGTAVVYDVGGTTLWWLGQSGLLKKIPCTGILSATVSDEGWLAITDQCSGYKGAVQIYTPSQEQAFTFYSSERFVTDACVLSGGKRFAAVTVGQKDGTFISNILISRLDSVVPESELAIEDGYVTHLGTVGSNLALAADTCLTHMNEKGELSGSYDYSALYLRECDFGGGDYTTILLSRFRSGTLGAVMTMESDGTVRGAEELDEEIKDISAAGDYVSVLYHDRVEIYRDSMELYAEKAAAQVSRIFQQEDGTVLAVGDSAAFIIVP